MKAAGSLVGAGGNSTKMFGSEKNVLGFLQGVDTSNVDKTQSNMTDYAKNMSQNFGNMGNYNFSVDGSDEARQRAEGATYQSYMDKYKPQFKQQTDDMQSRLVNQGLTPGSEAYQRAMDDLQNNQNDAMQQASYASINQGQNAFSQSLGDQMNAGSFGNNAQQGYINQILSLINGSPSAYDKNMEIFGIQSGADSRIAQNKAANKASNGKAMGDLLTAAGTAYAFSDERLKENIKPVGKIDNGLTVYLFNYIGAETPQIGLIAQEVQKVKPEAVIEGEDGFYRVNYKMAVE